MYPHTDLCCGAGRWAYLTWSVLTTNTQQPYCYIAVLGSEVFIRPAVPAYEASSQLTVWLTDEEYDACTFFFFQNGKKLENLKRATKV